MLIVLDIMLPNPTREGVIGTSFHAYALEEYKLIAQECFERVFHTGNFDKGESVYKNEEDTFQFSESRVGR